MTVCVGEPRADVVYPTVQLAARALLADASAQLPPPIKLPPVRGEVNATVPVGALWPLVAVSVTVAVHVLFCAAAIVLGEQLTSVAVARPPSTLSVCDTCAASLYAVFPA
jgi:hypothetical protein